MKASGLYPVLAIASGAQALGNLPTVAETYWAQTQRAVEAVGIPANLAAAGERAKEFVREDAAKVAGQAVQWVSENPGTAAKYGLMGVGLAAVAAPAAISSPALAAAGFGADGIVKASIAAGAQSGIGNVVAHSIFATLESAGMAGYGTAVVNGVVQAGGGLVVLASGGAAIASGGDAAEKARL